MAKILPRVTVIVPTYNRSGTIEACIDSILSQTYKNIELLISDDCSTDDTVQKIRTYKDKRINVIIGNVNKGPAAARNAAIMRAQGELIFFTDDDVIVPKNWIETGLTYFNDPRILGVEGRIIYVDKNYTPAYSDRIVQNPHGKLFMTANVAYRKSALLAVNMFDETLRQYEDRYLGFSVLKRGEIPFVHDFFVVHQREQYTMKTFFGEAKKVEYRILSLIRFNDHAYLRGPFYEPLKYLVMFFPFLLFTRLRTHRFASKKDWLFLLLAAPRLWYERSLIWYFALKYRRLVL